jgi:hypothetical protein
VRVADALGNRPDMNIAAVDLPAFLSVVWGSAAGEFWHAALKRGTWRKANRPKCWVYRVLLAVNLSAILKLYSMS